MSELQHFPPFILIQCGWLCTVLPWTCQRLGAMSHSGISSPTLAYPFLLFSRKVFMRIFICAVSITGCCFRKESHPHVQTEVQMGGESNTQQQGWAHRAAKEGARGWGMEVGKDKQTTCRKKGSVPYYLKLT